MPSDVFQFAAFLGSRVDPAQHLDESAVAIDLADPAGWPSPDSLVRRAVVAHLDAVPAGHDDPRLPHLARLARLAPFTVVTTALAEPRTPAQPPTRAPWAADGGASTPDGLARLLAGAGIDVRLVGVSNGCAEGPCVVAVSDACPGEAMRAVPDDFRPLALMAVYNEIDIVAHTVRRLLDDGVEVHVLDNWSVDGTYDAICALARHHAGLTVERFPAAGPDGRYDYLGILDWKERVAAAHPGRWIASVDADEVRCAPWPGVSLRAGLHVCDVMGYNAVDFTVLNFHAVDERFEAGLDPEHVLRHFEFGALSAYFVQVKVWKQGADRVNLQDSGGHEAVFAGRRVFPYKFLLKHYPLRNSAQARRKIFIDRLPRYSSETRARGWHFHYDHYRSDDRLLGDASRLLVFDEDRLRSEYLIPLLSGIGLTRR